VKSAGQQQKRYGSMILCTVQNKCRRKVTRKCEAPMSDTMCDLRCNFKVMSSTYSDGVK